MTKKPGQSKAAADKLVKSIRRKTRQTYSSEEKIRIVLAGLRGEESISNDLHWFRRLRRCHDALLGWRLA